MPTLPRKQIEALILGLLALTAVASLRFPVESSVLFIGEAVSIIALLLTSFFVTSANKNFMTRFAIGVIPIVFAIVARWTRSPIAIEMTALTTLGAASLAMATGSDRTRSMSMVASGFLTLFAVAISDSSQAIWIAIAWLSLCVWHLVANHWERLDLCAVQQVRRGSAVRPVSVLAAIVICVAGGLIVRGQFGESSRFSLGVMPTSGGNKWSDPAARSGVGTGDAAIAAKDNAESFGAVESDLFLESTESTLFDMFSDSIGEPKKKNKWERRQGLSSAEVLEAHQKTAKSEKGGNSFSTERMPPKKHLHLDDANENAMVQWAGPTGIRLAMNRYDTFDGRDWTNQSKHGNEKLSRCEIGDAVWFADPAIDALTASTTDVNLLKVIRLDSTRLPVPMMTSALHIKDIDRQDFFAIQDDGSYFMPGREKVPAMTVVNVAVNKLMEDELWESLSAVPVTNDDTKSSRLRTLVSQWTSGHDHPHEKLQAIVGHLRDDFIFDRDTESRAEVGDAIAEGAVDTFLRTRRGGDHLFATAAALMAREIGLRSRLVTGFYVRPFAVDVAAGHTNVLPQDVHAWVEIRLDDGRWFEIEPTPGYRQPIYAPSTWLMVKQFAAARWPHAIALMVLAAGLWMTRLFWIEIGLSVLYPIGALLWPSRQVMLAMGVLQTKAKLAGCPRVAGVPQRDWLLSLTTSNEALADSTVRFCDAADRAAFAGQSGVLNLGQSAKELLMNLNIKTFRQLAAEQPR